MTSKGSGRGLRLSTLLRVGKNEIGLIVSVLAVAALLLCFGLIAEDVFEVLDEGTVRIHEPERPESDRERMQQAVTQCPVAALRLTD